MCYRQVPVMLCSLTHLYMYFANDLNTLLMCWMCLHRFSFLGHQVVINYHRIMLFLWIWKDRGERERERERLRSMACSRLYFNNSVRVWTKGLLLVLPQQLWILKPRIEKGKGLMGGRQCWGWEGKGERGGGTIFGSVLESQINEFCNVRKTLVIKLW